jgi:hypothetical protein
VIYIVNFDDVAHDVSVQLSESGEVVLTEQATLPPAEYRGDFATGSSHHVSGVPTSRGTYELSVRLNDDEEHTVRTSDKPEAECFKFIGEVDRNQSIAIYDSTECPKETPTEA